MTNRPDPYFSVPTVLTEVRDSVKDPSSVVRVTLVNQVVLRFRLFITLLVRIQSVNPFNFVRYFVTDQ